MALIEPRGDYRYYFDYLSPDNIDSYTRFYNKINIYIETNKMGDFEVNRKCRDNIGIAKDISSIAEKHLKISSKPLIKYRDDFDGIIIDFNLKSNITKKNKNDIIYGDRYNIDRMYFDSFCIKLISFFKLYHQNPTFKYIKGYNKDDVIYIYPHPS